MVEKYRDTVVRVCCGCRVNTAALKLIYYNNDLSIPWHKFKTHFITEKFSIHWKNKNQVNAF